MAEIIENLSGRRIIRLSVDDVIDIVRQYQSICYSCSYQDVRVRLSEFPFSLPEDV